MGRSRMALIKETILPLVIFLLLALRFPVSGKPKTFLIETNDKDTENDDSIKKPRGPKAIVEPKVKSLNQYYQDVINVTKIENGKDDLEAIVLPCPIKKIKKNKRRSMFRSWTVSITDC